MLIWTIKTCSKNDTVKIWSEHKSRINRPREGCAKTNWIKFVVLQKNEQNFGVEKLSRQCSGDNSIGKTCLKNLGVQKKIKIVMDKQSVRRLSKNG